MTLRIDRLTTVTGSVLRISGRIAMGDLPIIRAALDDSIVVALDLAEIELIDRSAVRFLAQVEADGVELRHCPAYIREWVERERASD